MITPEQWTRMTSDLAVVKSKVEGFEAKLEKIEKEMDALTEMANRWRGVTAFLLGVGGLLGGLVAFWGRIRGTG